MRKLAATLSFILIISCGTGLLAQSTPDGKLFQAAKILIFDKKWEEAQAKLEELLERYPYSPVAGQAAFYRAECLNAREGYERQALKAYQEYIRRPKPNISLVEEAEGSIIDLAYALHAKGDKGILREIESRLEHANKVIRYYAAYKLALVDDERAAAKAVPVLEDIVESEKDPELTNRARIALLRISPESLESGEEKPPSRGSPRMIKIRVWTKGKKEAELSLDLPWVLADLTVSAILDSQKDVLRKKGYDVDKIMKQIVESREILRIEGDDSIIEIWIE